MDLRQEAPQTSRTVCFAATRVPDSQLFSSEKTGKEQVCSGLTQAKGAQVTEIGAVVRAMDLPWLDSV